MWAAVRGLMMSKNRKGMICILSSHEVRDFHEKQVQPDCSNHRHLSRRRVFERLRDARFADCILAQVYDAHGLLGFIVNVAGTVRWCEGPGDHGCKAWIDAISRRAIDEHVRRIQALVDAGNQPYDELIQLPQRRFSKRGVPSRGAAVNQTLRSHSPCSITARDSELNAGGAIGKRQEAAEKIPDH